MIVLDQPPQLVLPQRPAIVRPVADIAGYFPVDWDSSTRRAVAAALMKHGVSLQDRSGVRTFLARAERDAAAIPFGMLITRRWANMWLPGSAPQNDNWGSYFARSKIAPSAFLAGASTTVRVTFIAATTGSFAIRNAWIGNSGGGAVNFDGGQVRLTFGGANGITVPAGQTRVSDPATFAFNPSTNKVVHVSFNSANAVTYTTGTFQAYWKTGDDDGTTNPTSMSASFYALSSYGFSKIEVLI